MSDRSPQSLVFGITIALTFFVGAMQISNAQSSHKLQALYIYSFAKYVSWEQDSIRFTVGVFGKSDIIQELEKGARQRKISGKSVEVKQFNKLEAIERCHILYLPAEYSKSLPGLLAAIEGKPILVVTEDDLARKGAGIGFFIENNRLRFKLNIEVLKDLGLKVNKGLLDLAVVI